MLTISLGSVISAVLCISLSGIFSVRGWRLWNGRSYRLATSEERRRAIPLLVIGTFCAFEGTIGLLLGIDPWSLLGK